MQVNHIARENRQMGQNVNVGSRQVQQQQQQVQDGNNRRGHVSDQSREMIQGHNYNSYNGNYA